VAAPPPARVRGAAHSDAAVTGLWGGPALSYGRNRRIAARRRTRTCRDAGLSFMV
jgi:hypothetical protein